MLKNSLTMTLSFKEKLSAQHVFDGLRRDGGDFDIEDDFGAIASGTSDSVSALYFMDMDGEVAKQIDIQMMQAKAQQRARTVMQADPVNSIVRPQIING